MDIWKFSTKEFHVNLTYLGSAAKQDEFGYMYIRINEETVRRHPNFQAYL